MEISHRFFQNKIESQIDIINLRSFAGCDMLLYPAAFNMTTGPLHWELLQRARANDLQLFVGTVSPARNENSDYVAWGHSMVVDPWGKVIAQAQEKEEIVVVDIGKRE